MIQRDPVYPLPIFPNGNNLQNYSTVSQPGYAVDTTHCHHTSNCISKIATVLLVFVCACVPVFVGVWVCACVHAVWI